MTFLVLCLASAVLGADAQEVVRQATLENADAKRRREEAEQHFRAGLEALQTERYEKAEEELRACLRLAPEHYLAHYALGQTYMAAKSYPQAVTAYTNGREAFLEAARLRKDGSMAAEQAREDTILGQRDLKRELEAQLRLPMSESQRMLLQSRISNIDAGIRSLEQLRGSHLGSVELPPEFALALGSAYFRAGRRDDAKREYLEAVRLRPAYGQAHNNLAVIFMLEGDLRKAEEHLARAEKAGLKVDPALKKDIQSRKPPR